MIDWILNLEEVLSCIPPPITYALKCTTSKTTTKVNGDPPSSVMLWDDFFNEVNCFHFDQQPRFKRPQFIQNKVVLNEEDVCVAIDVNICMVLNRFMGPDCVFSRLSTHTTAILDFNCHHVETLILVIEVKRKYIF
ncbi:9316_t:CDS:2 [Entrophospora sp. SA101]|nr:6352_t:CDS:2 [Entrophospora sp. SA101]CAJ0912751.1 9316_t:CDS:2 [Entrophospora sp. SA101]